MSNIKPLFDRVVIKRMEEEKLSAGGIVIPDSATEKPIKGEVVAVGTGKVLDNGQLRAPTVKVGDKVAKGSIIAQVEAAGDAAPAKEEAPKAAKPLRTGTAWVALDDRAVLLERRPARGLSRWPRRRRCVRSRGPG